MYASRASQSDTAPRRARTPIAPELRIDGILLIDLLLIRRAGSHIG